MFFSSKITWFKILWLNLWHLFSLTYYFSFLNHLNFCVFSLKLIGSFSLLLQRHHDAMHHHQDFLLALRHYCDLPSTPVWFFNSFRALNPFQPAWIFVAAILQFCNSLRILNPFHCAWIFVADFSSIDVRSPPRPFDWPFFDLRLFLSCFRTRYPFHWAWILVAASSSDCDELGLLGCIALICIIGE